MPSTPHPDQPQWFGTSSPNGHPTTGVGVTVRPDPARLTAVTVTVGHPDRRAASGERATAELPIDDAERLAAALPQLVQHAAERLLAALRDEQRAAAERFAAKLASVQRHAALPPLGERVRRGAAVLDRCRPGWAQRIDPGRLERAGVLDQAGVDYGGDLHQLLRHTGTRGTATELDAEVPAWLVAHGFHLPDGEAHAPAAWAAAWRAAVTARRQPDHDHGDDR